MSDTETAKELIQMCCTGRLYDLERWIGEGRSIDISAASRRRKPESRLKYHSRKDDFGILVPHERGGLDIRVSSGTLDRALSIVAQVVAVLEHCRSIP